MKIPSLRRWLPLVGAGVLVATVVLRLVGQTDAADSVEGLANAVGLTAQSPVSAAEITAAVGVVMGIVLKVRAEIAKARAAKDT